MYGKELDPMGKPTTATEAVNHGAPEATRIDHTLHHLDDLLPQTAEGQTPRAEDARQDVEEALMQIRSVMDMILSAYSRVLFRERTVIHQYRPPWSPTVATASTVNDVQAKGDGR